MEPLQSLMGTTTITPATNSTRRQFHQRTQRGHWGSRWYLTRTCTLCVVLLRLDGESRVSFENYYSLPSSPPSLFLPCLFILLSFFLPYLFHLSLSLSLYPSSDSQQEILMWLNNICNLDAQKSTAQAQDQIIIW
jgi:hypothetical protein